MCTGGVGAAISAILPPTISTPPILRRLLAGVSDPFEIDADGLSDMKYLANVS
jgi:hypothetical protein